MSADTKAEARIVRTLAKFMADDQVLIGRWRSAGKAFTFAGAVLWVWATFAFLQDASVSWVYAALSGMGGVCIGLGLWFSNFVTQWPVVRQFIDAEKVRDRVRQMDDQSART